MKNINEMPFYMKQKTFSITNKLKEKIQGLTEREQQIYCHLFSHIRIHNNQEIPKKVFRDIARCDNDYVKYLKQLCEWGFIATDDYSFKIPSSGYGKCKRWKICDQSQPVKIHFECAPKYEKDESEILNNVMKHVHKCLNQLVVAKNVVESEDPDTAYQQSIWWKKFESKAWDIKYGKKDETRRLFHGFISSPKIVRKDLRHNQRKILCEFDICACHTIFLLKWCPEHEREVYKKLLDGDIYSILANEAGISRASMKGEFLYWANGRGFSAFSKQLREYCPELVKAFSEARINTSMALQLQKLESKLMLLQFGNWCYENNFFFINTHDGWCGKQSESERMINKLNEIFMNEFGYEPKIKSVRMEEI